MISFVLFPQALVPSPETQRIFQLDCPAIICNTKERVMILDFIPTRREQVIKYIVTTLDFYLRTKRSSFF